LAGYLAPILIGVLLPANFFDGGQTLCVFTWLTGYSCYGCGMTRALMHLIHFDLESAWQYNRLSFIVLPLFLVLIIQGIRKEVRQLVNTPNTENNN
jgi:biotin transporter BioY